VVDDRVEPAVARRVRERVRVAGHDPPVEPEVGEPVGLPGRPGAADDPEAAQLGEPDGRDPDAAGRARDEQPVARLDVRPPEHPLGGDVGGRQCRRRDRIDAVGQGEQAVGGHAGGWRSLPPTGVAD